MANVAVGSRGIDSGPLLRAITFPLGSPAAPVQSSRSGLLICTVHSSGWCNDIQEAIQTSSDAESLFADFKTNDVKTVLVPVLPTLSIFAKVNLINLGSGDDDLVLKCELRIPDDASPAPGDKALVNIGILCEGEGRMILRRLVLDWMSPYIVKGATPVSRCVSMVHTTERQRMLLAAYDVEDPRTRLGHHWTLTWYKKCMSCFQQEGAGSPFDPDLIPKI